MDKNNYVIHYRNLQLCLELGMKLKKIHRILKFKQSDWMKLYIDFNVDKRNESTNESDKNFFKLMNNAVYGKTMENMRKRIKIRLVTNEKDNIKYTSKPTCVRWNIYDKKSVAIHETKICLTLNKPIYVGFTVLKISKWEMYNSHYSFMIRKFNIKLLFTDTNRLCYQIHGKNPRKNIYQYKGLFDLSNYLKKSKYFCCDNKNVVGKMKDEYGAILIINK